MQRLTSFHRTLQWLVAITTCVGPVFFTLADERPKLPAAIRLENSAEIRVDEFRVSDATLLSTGDLVLVGTSDVREDADPASAPPAGAIVRWKTKNVERLTNGHKARIVSVSSSGNGNRLVTGSTEKDPVIRIWDIRGAKSLPGIDLSTFDHTTHYDVSCFSKSNTVAASLIDRVCVFDLDGKNERVDLLADGFSNAIPVEPVVSRDDYFLAYHNAKMQVAVWDLKSRKVVCSVSLLPKGADYHDWNIHTKRFTNSGKELLISRTGEKGDVPKGVSEQEISADKRGLFVINLEKQSVTALGIGQQIYTLGFALHPTDEWLVTVGPSWPDKGSKYEADEKVGELRIYHFPTRKLVQKLQFNQDEFYPFWVAVADDGKKVVAVDAKGIARRWDFLVTQ